MENFFRISNIKIHVFNYLTFTVNSIFIFNMEQIMQGIQQNTFTLDNKVKGFFIVDQNIKSHNECLF